MRLRTLLAILAIPAALAGCVAPGPGYYGRPAYYGAPAYGGGYHAPGYGGYYGGYRAPAYAAYAARPGWGYGGWWGRRLGRRRLGRGKRRLPAAGQPGRQRAEPALARQRAIPARGPAAGHLGWIAALALTWR